jgi:cytochrome c556
MAKGETPYDAQRATDAAENLLANARMKNSAMWPAGSNSDAPGLGEVTRAKAVIWSSFPEVGAKHQALTDALIEMVAIAGDGLDAVRTNMGAVANGCKGCHENFRVPED